MMLYDELKVTCRYNTRKWDTLNGIHTHLQKTTPLCTWLEGRAF